MIITEYKVIYRLRKKWNRLYQVSDTVTNPFQAYTPNRIYYDIFHLNVHRMFLRPRFIYAQDGPFEVIFPIILDRRRKRITEFAPLDYYDVLCSGPTALLSSVVQWIKDKYPFYEVRFTRVNQSAILSGLADLSQIDTEKCVSIPLNKETYEDYYQSLSKHQRQNLRTAYNKLQRESISFSLAQYDNGSMPVKLKRECMKMYEDRKAVKESPLSYLKRVYVRFTKPVFRIITEMVPGACFVLYLGNTPAAVMAGVFSKKGDQFVVPLLYSNNTYLRYSPGILLVNETAKALISKRVLILDLARGDEPYKYALGGETHFNYTYRIS